MKKENWIAHRPRSRKLRLEILENRRLLSVSQVEFEAIRGAFPEWEWTENLENLSVMELTDITAASLQAAVDRAAGTAGDDLILLRVSDASRITLSEQVSIGGGKWAFTGKLAVVGIDPTGSLISFETLFARSDYSINSGLSFNGHYYFDIPETTFETESFGPFPTQMIESKSLIDLDDYLNDSRFSNLTGSGYATVIIDTGICLTHTEFSNRIIYQWDFADNDDDATDNSGHGTHVAGIAAGSTYGIAQSADIIALKVFADDSDKASDDSVQAALQWVIENAWDYNIVSVNLSLGTENFYQIRTSSLYADEFAVLAEMNITVCAAAGNGYDQKAFQYEDATGVASPACDPNVLSVAATWNGIYSMTNKFTGETATSTVNGLVYFSQRDEITLDIAAPGAKITSAGISSDTATAVLNGTSMATPVISGTVILAQAVANEYLGRSLTVEEIRTLLRNTATVHYDGKITDVVPGMEANYYLVNVYAMAEAIYAMGTSAQPDLSVYVPSGWNADLVVSTEPLAVTNAKIYYSQMDYYVNLGVANLSLTDVASPVRVTLTLSGAADAVTTYDFDSFAAMKEWNSLENAWRLGALDVGDYTVTVTIDSDGVITEFDETNNTQSYSFTVIRDERIPVVVTTPQDVVDAFDGLLSLREAISCAGTSEMSSVITFSPDIDWSLEENVILLTDGELTITKTLTIDGSNGPNITLSANGESRVFNVVGGSEMNSVTLVHLIVTGGYGENGGGILNYGVLTLVDCLVFGNQATYDGGGIESYGVLTLIGCTISGNVAYSRGGGIDIDRATNRLTLYNTIIAQNVAWSNGNDIYRHEGTVEAYYSLSSFTDWNASESCFVYDVKELLFTDRDGNDYTLCDGSQAINLGKNDYVTTETDLAGNARISDRIVDLGAFEYPKTVLEPLVAPTIFRVTSAGTDGQSVTWSEVEFATGYELAYSTDQTTWTAIRTSQTTLTVTELTYGAIVYYRVKALSEEMGHVDSDWSEIMNSLVCPLDIDGDGYIGPADRGLLVAAWFSSEESERWDARCDIDGDGFIGPGDWAFLTSSWLKSAVDVTFYPPVK